MIEVSAGNVIRAALSFGLGLATCGYAPRAGSQSPKDRPQINSAQQERDGCSNAQRSDIVIGGVQPGSTPFIASVELRGHCVRDVVSVTFTIAPKPNSASAPVKVTWDLNALADRGYLQPDLINLPVFGLYDGYQNQVTFRLRFLDQSIQWLEYPIVTAAYTDPLGIFKSPTILKARAPGSVLGFNFLFLKSSYGTPVIVDTDGELRWLVPDSSNVTGALSQYFVNGQILVGNKASPTLANLQLDGTQTAVPAAFPRPLMGSFTHNIDPGPSPGTFLAEFNGVDDLGTSLADIVAVVSPYSKPPVIETFNMADILTSYMKANGDDPTQFVRPGADWFHVNASTYDSSDDSVIVSSRENFLIKLDRKTQQIVWILGNPNGFWYTFPSLRAKALTLDPGGDYPIGQHGVSITSDGYLMLFNDGEGSLNQPADNGISRTYSEVSVYSVNAAKMTAHQVWSFDYGKSIFTEFCGSVYEAEHSYLVDFANELSNSNLSMRLVGLGANRQVAFDFRYAQTGTCGTAWNAVPINLENMEIHPSEPSRIGPLQ